MKPERRERIIQRHKKNMAFLRRHIWVVWGAAVLWCVLAAILCVRGHPWIAAGYVTNLILTLDVILMATDER